MLNINMDTYSKTISQRLDPMGRALGCVHIDATPIQDPTGHKSCIVCIETKDPKGQQTSAEGMCGVGAPAHTAFRLVAPEFASCVSGEIGENFVKDVMKEKEDYKTLVDPGSHSPSNLSDADELNEKSEAKPKGEPDEQLLIHKHPSYERVKSACETKTPMRAMSMPKWEKTMTHVPMRDVVVVVILASAVLDVRYSLIIIASICIWVVVKGMSHKAWNKLMHALHGNGIRTKLYTSDIPKLPRNASTAEEYIIWSIDLKLWAIQAGIAPLICGPLPVGTTVDDRNEAVQYLCAAIEDKNLRALVGTQGLSAGGAPAALAWLENEFLQGIAKQPALNEILDSITLQSEENFVVYKARFLKLSTLIVPPLAQNVLCTKFAKGIKRSTGREFDACITSTAASTDMDDFDAYSRMLIKLCTQKRSMDGESSHQTSTDLSALRAEVTALQNRINAPRKHDGRQSRNTATPRTSGRGDKHAQNCDILWSSQRAGTKPTKRARRNQTGMP